MRDVFGARKIGFCRPRQSLNRIRTGSTNDADAKCFHFGGCEAKETPSEIGGWTRKRKAKREEAS